MSAWKPGARKRWAPLHNHFRDGASPSWISRRTSSSPISVGTRVRHRVASDLVAGLEDSVDVVRPLANALADQEERRMRVVLAQQFHDRSRPHRRPVVERERNLHAARDEQACRSLVRDQPTVAHGSRDGFPSRARSRGRRTSAGAHRRARPGGRWSPGRPARAPTAGQLLVLLLLEVGVHRPAVRAAVGIAEPLRDPLHHLVGERVAELVGVDVRFRSGVAEEIGQHPLDQAMSPHDLLGALEPLRRQQSPPCARRVRSAPRPRAASASPADAREMPSISRRATRAWATRRSRGDTRRSERRESRSSPR